MKPVMYPILSLQCHRARTLPTFSCFVPLHTCAIEALCHQVTNWCKNDAPRDERDLPHEIAMVIVVFLGDHGKERHTEARQAYDAVKM